MLFLLIFCAGLFAQNLSIQGVARDNSGQSLADATYGFTFRLHTVASGGSVVWQEVQNLSVLNGVFSAILGNVNSMSGLDFNEEYWLSLEIDGNGEMSPRTKLILSPYTIMADLSGTTNVFPESGNVGIGIQYPNAPLHVIGDLQLSDANIPIGLTSELGGDSPLLNFDLNNFHSNRNTAVMGATFRIDSRGGIYEPFQWLLRPAGDTGSGLVIMCLEADGDLEVKNRLRVSSDLSVGSLADVMGNLTAHEDLTVNEDIHALRDMSVVGNVGVGGNLNVDGDLTVAGRRAVTAENNTRIIHGRINANGSIAKGSGFTCTRLDGGYYSIGFTQSFSDHPTVTVSGFGSMGGNYMWMVYDVGYGGVEILNRDRNHEPYSTAYGADCSFTFIAVGNR